MKILVVEDNKNLAESLKIGLTQEGYTVDTLEDGDTAVRRILARPKGFDLVILDIMLPKKSGLQVCAEIREYNVIVPVLMLTAKDTTSDKVKGLDAGADDYLVKPFSFEELLARIRALLRRPKETMPTILSLGGITLNSATKELSAAGKSVALSFREFGILEYLMRHPNQVLTREQIIQRVWEHSFEGLSNIVDAHIKNLRKKLGSEHGNYIETLRGMGYKFKV